MLFFFFFPLCCLVFNKFMLLFPSALTDTVSSQAHKWYQCYSVIHFPPQIPTRTFIAPLLPFRPQLLSEGMQRCLEGKDPHLSGRSVAWRKQPRGHSHPSEMKKTNEQEKKEAASCTDDIFPIYPNTYVCIQHSCTLFVVFQKCIFYLVPV